MFEMRLYINSVVGAAAAADADDPPASPPAGCPAVLLAPFRAGDVDALDALVAAAVPAFPILILFDGDRLLLIGSVFISISSR